MEKRKLSAIPRPSASDEMIARAKETDLSHYVTTEISENLIILNFFKIATLKKNKREAEFRTFLSNDDYISQDLTQKKVKWITSSFAYMYNFRFTNFLWDKKKKEYRYIEKIRVWSKKDEDNINEFFSSIKKSDDENIWKQIYRFQDQVMQERLLEKHRKILDPIDLKMESIKEVPKEFYDWVWEHGMSFSRYGIYKEVSKGMAEIECTYCKRVGTVDRNKIRLRNNEKGECPFCRSKVTFKARGKLPAQIIDKRWFVYVDSQEEGFLLRYFEAYRHIRNDSYIERSIFKGRTEESIYEYNRCFWNFSENKPRLDCYKWGVYHQKGSLRWIPDEGKIDCMACILYPGNLPQAWEHTPMKYSALEILSEHIPTISLRYEEAMKVYLKFPKLEWLCKMGLNCLVKNICEHSNFYRRMVGKINYDGDTIYEILGLTKINTRILQQIDGNHYELRLLQVAQKLGIQMRAEQLKEFYEIFECNTTLLETKHRKVSLHKLCKYIAKESERYPIGEKGYSYQRYTERKDPRVERKQNMAHDWLEYLEWCRELKYDLDNMFIYMPNNFKKVHDRTAKEYQELIDKKAAAEKARRDKEAAKKMAQTKKAMEELFRCNEDVDAFQIHGKNLILVVPKDGADIRKEGEALRHCVGGYVEKVARSETSIFFIRKADKPDESYYTMEWRDNRIIQCRGLRNCGMTPEVKAFVSVFEKKMQEQIAKNTQEKVIETEVNRKVG